MFGEMMSRIKERRDRTMALLERSIEVASELENIQVSRGMPQFKVEVGARILAGIERARGIKVLLERGHGASAAVLLRSLVEQFIIAGWVGQCNERALVSDNDQRRRLKLLLAKLEELGVGVAHVSFGEVDDDIERMPPLPQMAVEADKNPLLLSPIYEASYESMYRLYSGWVHGYRRFLEEIDGPLMDLMISLDAAGVLIHLTTWASIVLRVPEVKLKADRLIELLIAVVKEQVSLDATMVRHERRSRERRKQARAHP